MRVKFGIHVFRSSDPEGSQGELVGFVKDQSERDASEKLQLHEAVLEGPRSAARSPATYLHDQFQLTIRLAPLSKPINERLLEIKDPDDLYQILVRL